MGRPFSRSNTNRPAARLARRGDFVREPSPYELILKRLGELEANLNAKPDAVLTALASRPAEPSPLDVFTLAEANRSVGVAPRPLRDGKAGTRAIPRHHIYKPVQFLRAALDQWKRGAYDRERQKLQHQPERAVPSLARRRARRKDCEVIR